MASSSDLLTPAEAGAILDRSAETLRQWAAAKKVRHIRLPSGQIRFRLEDIEAILHPIEPVEAVG